MRAWRMCSTPSTSRCSDTALRAVQFTAASGSPIDRGTETLPGGELDLVLARNQSQPGVQTARKLVHEKGLDAATVDRAIRLAARGLFDLVQHPRALAGCHHAKSGGSCIFGCLDANFATSRQAVGGEQRRIHQKFRPVLWPIERRGAPIEFDFAATHQPADYAPHFGQIQL